jgi:hypothetical protein
MANPNRMVRSTGGAARNAIGKAYVKPKMAGTSAAGAGKRGIRDIAKGAAPKGPGKDGAYKPGDMFRSGRIVQPSAVSGKAKPKAKPRGGAAREGMGSKSGGRATTMGGFGATAPRKSAAGRGKGGEAMGRNKSSSAQAGKYAPKKKASLRGRQY